MPLGMEYKEWEYVLVLMEVRVGAGDKAMVVWGRWRRYGAEMESCGLG